MHPLFIYRNRLGQVLNKRLPHSRDLAYSDMNISKDELSNDERVRTLETRTVTWLRVAVVQQVILVVLLA